MLTDKTPLRAAERESKEISACRYFTHASKCLVRGLFFGGNLIPNTVKNIHRIGKYSYNWATNSEQTEVLKGRGLKLFEHMFWLSGFLAGTGFIMKGAIENDYRYAFLQFPLSIIVAYSEDFIAKAPPHDSPTHKRGCFMVGCFPPEAHPDDWDGYESTPSP